MCNDAVESEMFLEYLYKLILTGKFSTSSSIGVGRLCSALQFLTRVDQISMPA